MASKFLPLDEKLSEVFKGGGKSHVLFSGAVYFWHMHKVLSHTHTSKSQNSETTQYN